MYSATVSASRVKRLSAEPPAATARSKPRLAPLPLVVDADGAAAPAAPAPRWLLRELPRELRFPLVPAWPSSRLAGCAAAADGVFPAGCGGAPEPSRETYNNNNRNSNAKEKS